MVGQSDLNATLRVSEVWYHESAGDYDVFLTVQSESSWTLHWR